ncbi:MAG TPA: MTH1187 family thiamine-binding protein [Thermoanaerobaculia bacterium]
MLAEISIVPLGRGEHLSTAIAEVLDVVDRSGVRYKFTPCGTCLEGDWEEVMQVVRQCHAKARQGSRHVMTTVRIEDEEGENDKLVRNVTSVEEKLGRQLAETGGIVR